MLPLLLWLPPSWGFWCAFVERALQRGRNMYTYTSQVHKNLQLHCRCLIRFQVFPFVCRRFRRLEGWLNTSVDQAAVEAPDRQNCREEPLVFLSQIQELLAIMLCNASIHPLKRCTRLIFTSLCIAGLTTAVPIEQGRGTRDPGWVHASHTLFLKQNILRRCNWLL